VDAFDTSLASPWVLLDDVTLPSDDGERITAAIVGGTAGVVSDGSFDSEGRHGSSSFTIAATQDADEEHLDRSRYVTGSAEDQSAHDSSSRHPSEIDRDHWRRIYPGSYGVLATVAILVTQFHQCRIIEIILGNMELNPCHIHIV